MTVNVSLNKGPRTSFAVTLLNLSAMIKAVKRQQIKERKRGEKKQTYNRIKFTSITLQKLVINFLQQ
jgi:hypothetical protein